MFYGKKRKKLHKSDPCPCGSGKRHKFCCRNKSEDERSNQELLWETSIPPNVFILSKDGITIETENTLRKESIEDITVIRPRFMSELNMRKKYESVISSTFKPGKYYGNDIAKFIELQFKYLKTEFDLRIKQLASRNAIELVMHEFDQWSRLSHSIKMDHPKYFSCSHIKRSLPLCRKHL